MKHRFIALFAALLLPLFAQEPDHVNSVGQGIDTPAERTAFKTALQLENVDNTSDAGKPVSAATQTALDAKADKSTLTWIDVTKPPYNAAGDAECRFDGAITSGTATLTSATANFPTTVVGKYIRVEGAGAAGADLITTIATRNSGTSITLSVNASTTVSSKAIFWGTNDSTAIQSAITAASTSTITRTVYFPPLKFLASNLTLTKNVKLLGCYRGSNIESIFSVAQLADRNLTGTVLFPATTATPVIYGDAGTTGEIFGAGVEGFVISGSSAKHGTAIKFGGDWGTTINFTSGSTDIVRCQISGFDTAIKHSNAVEGNIEYVHWNDCNTGVELWAHDGITVSKSGSNNITGGNNFRIGGCKNVVIETGNYNNFARFADITDSSVYVDAVNVEVPTAECFATRFSSDATRLIVGHVKLLNSTTGILVRDYYPEAQKQNVDIEIQSVTGNSNYWDSANTNYPRVAPPCSYIRRYTDNTFATLQQTETVGRVYFTEQDRRTHAFLEESFASRLSASPYCDLGWTATTVGTWDLPNNTSSAYALNLNQFAPGGFRCGSSTASTSNILRFTAASAVVPPGGQAYWYLRAAVESYNSDTGIYRFGIYSSDAATSKPQYGVGILADTGVNANIQLEVITAGVSSLTSTTIPVANANPALSTLRGFKDVILQHRPTLGLSVIIKDLNGVALAPEVFATGIPTNWSGYHFISCYAGSNTNTGIDVNFGKMTFIRYRTSM
jgi:hypothetical protein